MGELIEVLFRFLILVIVGVLIRSLFRSVIAGFRPGGGFRTGGVPSQADRQPPVVAAGDLKKDPVCGTYVSPAASLMRIVNGETFYFCSQECRDRYQAH